ncbi:MAG: [protein-PII] uridylyltransferase [Pirellulaceae bacterium]
MATGSGLSEYILKAKKWHRQGRVQLHKLHDEGAAGRRVVNGMSDLVDNILILLYRSIRKEMEEEGEEIHSRVALVLHGGCGRREMAPYSDIDFMTLYRGHSDEVIEEFARRYTQAIFDTGFQLGFSLRTPREACSMALGDPLIFSSLTESRVIGGSSDLYQNFLSRLKRIGTRRASHLIRSIVAAREAERVEFGETVYLLRPNVKKTRGGLRDVHLMRWLGFVRFGETDFDQLCRKGALSSIDAVHLNSAREFLLRLRNELHFHADRANDMLGKNEQVRIAKKWDYKGSEVSLPVEQMMRDYFNYTGEIRYLSDHFVDISRHRRSFANVFDSLISRPIDDVFCMTPFHIGVQPEAIDQVKTDLASVLRLMQLSVIYSREIEHETWETIRDSMTRSRDVRFSQDTGQQFLALLRNPRNLGFMLRRLAEMRVLERIIPPFAHARSLMQFNEYHKFTVDEHSIQAVERATEYEDEKGPLGKAYRALRDKSILHLALLIHDLGKGYPEDHSEVGRRLAEEICPRLGVDPEDAETVKFLVHNHLMMSHVAFQRDINDENLVAEFAANVGSKKMLRLLYLLTCADISAVGPGTLNQWKFGLLSDLYRRALNLLEGMHDEEVDESIKEEELATFRDMAPDEETANWLLQQARSLPRNFYRGHTTEEIASQLLELRETTGYQSACSINYDKDAHMVELCIGRRVKRRSGIFYRITGMLASEGLRIRTADIKHLDESFVWYWFQFDDPNLNEPPSEQRLNHVLKQARQLAEAKETGPPAFPIRWQDDPSRRGELPMPPIKVLIDNQAVAQANVIDVFAWYRLGLLYRISKRIYELKLDVQFARVALFGMQVIAVFYVTDEDGHNITDARRLVEVRRALYEETRDYLESDRQS